jgi:cell division transport system permease protein
MSGSSDRPGDRPGNKSGDATGDRGAARPNERLATPPLRPSLQRALMQQRQRVEPTYDDPAPYPAPVASARVPRADLPPPFDPYGYDQYPEPYDDSGGSAHYGYGSQPNRSYNDDVDEPRTGPPVRVPVSLPSNDPATYEPSAYEASTYDASQAPPSRHTGFAEPQQTGALDTAQRAPVSRRLDDAGTRVQRPPAPTMESLPTPRPEPLAADKFAADEMFAPSRRGAKQRQAGAPIVPAGSVTGRSLTLVISIMCFLACLTAGAVYMMNQSAAAWMRDIASEITVQIEAKDKVDPEKQLRDVSQFLARQPGIRNVRPLSVTDSAQLLEPWLGQSDALKSLPIPRLIAIEIDRAQPPDLAQIRTQMTAQFKGVSLDDHRHWQQQIRTVTRSFALGGLAILMLVGAATTAIIVSATRSALAANREIVEVLHFVGATDKFIAREFEKHFLRLGIRAGLVGAISAMLVFLALPFVMELLGGGTVTIAEIRRMIGTGTLDVAGYVLLGIVVFVISALCMLTSRIGVYGILHTQR